MNIVESQHCCSVNKSAENQYTRVKGHVMDMAEEGLVIHYKKGQFLFYEGHMPCGFYVIRKGGVSFFQSCSNGPSCEDASSDKLVGLLHLLSQTPHCCSCRVDRDVEAVFFPKQAVSDFLNKIGSS